MGLSFITAPRGRSILTAPGQAFFQMIRILRVGALTSLAGQGDHRPPELETLDIIGRG
jgi:hypothetical protein